jgi:hypothetical protein
MNDTTFTTPIGAALTLYTIAYELSFDVDDGRPTESLELFGATDASGHALTIDQIAEHEGLDLDELHDQLRERAREVDSTRYTGTPDGYYEQAAEDYDEPTDLDEGFDPYMGQYTDDC